MTPLKPGAGVWIKGPPGSGKSHALKGHAAAFPGEVLSLRPSVPTWLHTLPAGVLICMDDAPQGTPRSAFPPGLAVVVAGAKPGPGWEIQELAPLSEDQGMALFLRHAPGSGSREALRKLVRRLDGHPTGLIAAARRWPAENLDAILEQPSQDWPGLRDAYQALGEPEREALALLSRLPGPVQGEGLRWCGRLHGAQGLVAAGWVQIGAPGCYQLPPAIAERVQGWRAGDAAPYLAWFLQQTRRRMARWDSHGGSREWFRSGLWTLLWERWEGPPEAWFFLAWSLSGQAPQALLHALTASPLEPILRARCAARAHQAQGERELAVRILGAALEQEGGPPEHYALARLELGTALHRLRDLPGAQAAYRQALEALTALEMDRGAMLAHANLAAVEHDAGRVDGARSGYQQAISRAAGTGAHRVQGIFCSNLGALLLETQELALARATLAQAEQCLAQAPDDRFLAITRVNQAAVELQQGHLEAADARYQQALGLLKEADPSSSALCHARRGAVAALAGDLDRARGHHARAEALAPLSDPLTLRLVALWRVFLEWQAQDRPSALARRRQALSSAEGPSLIEVSDEARLVLRLLEPLATRPEHGVVVGPQGAWFRLPSQEAVSVQAFAAVARILAHLAQRAEEQPGSVSDAEDLIHAGWPGERIQHEAARNRLAVSLSKLRKLGLKAQLQRTKDGWRLDPDWSVILLREG